MIAKHFGVAPAQVERLSYKQLAKAADLVNWLRDVESDKPKSLEQRVMDSAREEWRSENLWA